MILVFFSPIIPFLFPPSFFIGCRFFLQFLCRNVREPKGAYYAAFHRIAFLRQVQLPDKPLRIRARKRLPCAGAPPRNRIRSSHTYPLPHYYTTFCIAAEMYTSLLPGSKKASDFSEALGSQHLLCCYFTSFFVECNAVDPNIAAPLVPQIHIISALVDLLYGSVAGIL